MFRATLKHLRARKLRLVTEKNLDMQYAFLTLAAAVICHRYLRSSFC